MMAAIVYKRMILLKGITDKLTQKKIFLGIGRLCNSCSSFCQRQQNNYTLSGLILLEIAPQNHVLGPLKP